MFMGYWQTKTKLCFDYTLLVVLVRKKRFLLWPEGGLRPQADQPGHDLGKIVNKVGGVCFCTCSPTWPWVLTSTLPSWNRSTLLPSHREAVPPRQPLELTEQNSRPPSSLQPFPPIPAWWWLITGQDHFTFKNGTSPGWLSPCRRAEWPQPTW